MKPIIIAASIIALTSTAIAGPRVAALDPSTPAPSPSTPTESTPASVVAPPSTVTAAAIVQPGISPDTDLGFGARVGLASSRSSGITVSLQVASARGVRTFRDPDSGEVFGSERMTERSAVLAAGYRLGLARGATRVWASIDVGLGYVDRADPDTGADRGESMIVQLAPGIGAAYAITRGFSVAVDARLQAIQQLGTDIERDYVPVVAVGAQLAL